MRLLWVKTDFLHPTTRGGQIRTLEILKRLHCRHEIHYVAFEDLDSQEGAQRAHEYCTHFYPIPHKVPKKSLATPAFVVELLRGLASPVPVTVRRWTSAAMRAKVVELDQRKRFDAIVCDFLFCAANIPDLNHAILFQHNVEAQIWQRQASEAEGTPRRLYFRMQASRMAAYERRICQQVRRVIAVSDFDVRRMRENYQVRDIAAVSTGVDIGYFARREAVTLLADLVFLGSMDWMPNVDGVRWFISEILPRIHAVQPGVRVAIVGRKPTPEIVAMAGPHVEVTGTVMDVRPWLWGARLSIVPLRIGGGTRLKIYESMAAGVPVLSTSVGAEGLQVRDGENIAIADDAECFARRCIELLAAQSERDMIAERALRMVTQHCSWDSVTQQFEDLLR